MGAYELKSRLGLTRALRDIVGLMTLRKKMKSANKNKMMMVWLMVVLTRMIRT